MTDLKEKKKGFQFNFDSNKVISEIFEDGTEGKYPAIVWHGRHSASSNAGYWTIDQHRCEERPGPLWEQAKIRFGSDPDAEEVDVWRTNRLRACVLGVRKRQIITGESGETFRYPWKTKKRNRKPGKFQAHFQVAVTLYDTNDRIFIIALKGLTKTVSWNNPVGGRYRKKDFPTGVEVLLRGYAAQASKEHGAPIPHLCRFWIDLVPVIDDRANPSYVEVRSGTHMLPFTADFSVNDELPYRFVEMERFISYQNLRQKEIVEWEQAWVNHKTLNFEGGVNPYENPSEDDLEPDDLAY